MSDLKSGAFQMLELTEGATVQEIQSAYARMDQEVEKTLALHLPEAIRAKLTGKRAALSQARDQLSADPPTQGAPGPAPLDPAAVVADAKSSPSGIERRIPIGSQLGSRYEVVECLGAGAMGRVYRAFDQLKQCYVAVKVIPPEIAGQRGVQEQFLNEARLASSMSHPNIIRVHDVGIDVDLHFITIELLHGQTLRARMEAQKRSRVPFPIDQGLRIARGLLGALAYAHQHRVHLDLQPENVWVCDDGTPKIMDFGLARSMDCGAGTKTSQSVGSAYFGAPEQLRGVPLDHRADQYAIAVILYELLSGRVPAGVIAPLNKLRKQVPPRISRAIMRGLNPSAQGRYAQIDDFWLLLDRAGRTGLRTSLGTVAISAFVVLLVYGAVALSKQGRSASAARQNAPAELAAAASARATPAPGTRLQDQAHSEYLRSGRQFTDPLRSGGRGPALIVGPAVRDRRDDSVVSDTSGEGFQHSAGR
jgi:hypothetical protein